MTAGVRREESLQVWEGAASKEEAVCGERRELGLEVFMGTRLGVDGPRMRRGL